MFSDTCPEILALQGFLPFSMFFLHPFARCLRLRLMAEKKSNVTVYYSTKGLSFQHHFIRILPSPGSRNAMIFLLCFFGFFCYNALCAETPLKKRETSGTTGRAVCLSAVYIILTTPFQEVSCKNFKEDTI